MESKSEHLLHSCSSRAPGKSTTGKFKHWGELSDQDIDSLAVEEVSPVWFLLSYNFCHFKWSVFIMETINFY